MFIHRHPRHRLARLLPAGLRVAALFALPFAAAALLGSHAGTTTATTAVAAGAGDLPHPVAQLAGVPPATPHAAQ